MPAPTINPRKVNPNYELSTNKLRYSLSNYPFIGDLLRVYDTNQKMSDYMSNRGLSWDSVKYPSLLGGGSYSSLMSLPSDSMNAVEKMYDEKEAKIRKSWSDYYRDEFYKSGTVKNNTQADYYATARRRFDRWY